jgi:hypothetical protein
MRVRNPANRSTFGPWEAALAAMCALTFVAKLIRGFPDNQWDFRVYYYAARAWTQGVNPYLVGNLPATTEGGFAYTYLPCTLPLFWPFTLLALNTALLVFLALKLILLASLIVIWSRILRVRVTEPLWVLFLLLAYSSTIFIDFASGNIVTIEQWLVWIGLASLLRKQYAAFVALIVAASLFKLTPIVLLIMCVWIPERRRYRYFAAGVGAFAGILVLNYAFSPRWTADFFRLVTSFDERQTTNPALLPLVRDVTEKMARAYGVGAGPLIPTAIYAAVAATVVAITWIVARRVADTPEADRIELILYLVLLAFAAAAPRFKNYAYMLVLVPTYFVATRASRLPAAVSLVIIACLSTNSWITRPENTAFIGSYSSWFIAVGAWALLVYELNPSSESNRRYPPDRPSDRSAS